MRRLPARQLVANPGCYPTSAILPLAPLLRDRLIEPKGITVCSISGLSGAGRSASVELSYAEMHGNVRAYRAPDHQHVPEIAMALTALSGIASTSVTFVPHLAPIARGIYTTITAELADGVNVEKIDGLFNACYGDEPFIRCSSERIPEINDVVNTNSVDIGFRIDRINNRLILFSAIDNLIKGAAGQAVQNMNIMLGFPETEGLL